GNVAVLKLLLRMGADVTVQDECGRTPLLLACQFCDLNIIKPLVRFYDSVDSRANDGATALMIASQCANLQVVEALLEQGADPNLASYIHTMAIHRAVQAEALGVVQLLLKVTSKEAILLHCKHPQIGANSSLCCLAIDCENLEMLETLVTSDLGNEILHIPTFARAVNDENDGESRFEFKYTQSSSISFLLESKLSDLREETITYLKLLLKHGFPVNASNSNCIPSLSALSLEAEENDLTMQCLDILLEHGADIDYTTKCAGVPDALLAACLTGKCVLLLKLLRVGSSGLPDDLLRYLLVRYLDLPHNIPLGKMINFLLELGISKPYLYKRLRCYMSDGMEDLKKNISKPLAELQLCSLQQLSRIAVRRQLKQPFSTSLNQLTVPECIKDYITYKLL
ncbi:hypothetical protein L9F63_007558, partial [Diploptera punctata]